MSFIQRQSVTVICLTTQNPALAQKGCIFTFVYDIAGALIVLALYTLTPLFYYIPKAALSAVIIFSVMQMVDVMIVKKLWKVNSKSSALLG